MNGQQIAQCMINYIEAINKPGGIPDVKSAWSNIQTLESKNLIKQVKEGI